MTTSLAPGREQAVASRGIARRRVLAAHRDHVNGRTGQTGGAA